MKKKKSRGDHRNCSFSEEEIEVSNVLLDLPKLVFKSDTLRSFSVRVPTRRRSSLAGAGNSSTSIKNSPQSVDSASGHSKLKPSTNPKLVLKLKFVKSCSNVKNPSFHVDLKLCSSTKQLQIRSPKECKNVVFDFDLNQEWEPATFDYDQNYPQEDEKQETQQQQLSTAMTPMTRSYDDAGGGMDLCAPEFNDVNRLLREHYNRKTAEA